MCTVSGMVDCIMYASLAEDQEHSVSKSKIERVDMSAIPTFLTTL